MFPENSYTVTVDLNDVKYDCVVYSEVLSCTRLKRLIALCRVGTRHAHCHSRLALRRSSRSQHDHGTMMMA